MATKSFYYNPQRLLAARQPGTAARTLLIYLLEAVSAPRLPTAVGDVNGYWRSVAKWT
jgi:hypothetical protein